MRTSGPLRGLRPEPAGGRGGHHPHDGFGDALYAGTAAADQQVIDSLGRVARARGSTRSRVALAWLLRNPVVTAPIIGVTSIEQLDDLLCAPDLALCDEEVEELERHYVPHPVAGFG